ncbi:MAG TPA: hypothetical protein PLT09_05200 [Deltaproteobacteria bacterium]|nr:hypothetical protein [Deltaproteobacteria bacterium]HPR54034.1 hypothetical protein [Deltaproteobacteria bacterium]HXK46814.1 hypothetical protein [Deltaproteobacteria bacterium]
MKRIGTVVFIGAWILVLAFFAFAQQPDQADPELSQVILPDGQDMNIKTYIELMRTNLRAQKKQIVSRSMGLDEMQTKAFWPLYDDYEHDLAKLTDRGVDILMDYAKNYETMTDETASDIMNRTLDNQDEKLKLRRAYAKKMEDALSAKVAARFLQVDAVVNKMIELQIDSKLPLVK